MPSWFDQTGCHSPPGRRLRHLNSSPTRQPPSSPSRPDSEQTTSTRPPTDIPPGAVHSAPLERWLIAARRRRSRTHRFTQHIERTTPCPPSPSPTISTSPSSPAVTSAVSAAPAGDAGRCGRVDGPQHRSRRRRGRPSPPLRDKQLLIASGKGKVTDELPFCFHGAPGPCGWIVQAPQGHTDPLRNVLRRHRQRPSRPAPPMRSRHPLGSAVRDSRRRHHPGGRRHGLPERCGRARHHRTRRHRRSLRPVPRRQQRPRPS